MPERLDARAKKIIDEAMELSGSARAEHLDEACRGEPELRSRVDRLIAGLEREDPFLSDPTIEQTPSRGLSGERPGTRIGPYKLLELIGEGGFGSVFMADQSEPVRRRVALKIIKLGMDTRAVVARFEQERQALAMMDHPNVARVLDAGATEAGRPYFVMELVKGKPITAYCDQANLTIPDRLELFMQVCRAVQHAHTKGIIHRDIKPSNVLVSEQDGKPACKIIDFGIAKATQQPLTEKTVFTEFRQLIGTPEYMSPEQAAGSLDIDTRTDVYSLGVLLYELLAGVTPIDPVRLRSAAYAEMQRIIREVDPPAPSTRLSQSGDNLASIAATRRTEPGRLGSIIRGELDWIVMRALEKDRARRYDTAGNLATDIGRYLTGQPVEAAPPSTVYRLRKFVRRHRGVVAASLAIGAGLLIGLTAALWQANVAAHQRDAAKTAEAKAIAAEAISKKREAETERIAEFQAAQLGGINAAKMGEQMRRDLLTSSRERMKSDGRSETDIAAAQGQLERLLGDINTTDVALSALDEEVFVRALSAIESEFKDQPLIKARLLLTVGNTLTDLGLYDRAAAPITEALAIRRRELGDDDRDTLAAVEGVGVLQFERGDHTAAEVTLRKNLADRRRVLGSDDRDTLQSMNSFASVLQAQQRLTEAEPLFKESLETARRVFGPDDEDTLLYLNNVGSLLYHQHRLAEAEPICKEAHERMVRVIGPDAPNTLYALANIGLVLQDLGRAKEAEAILREVVDRRRRVQGDTHRFTIASVMDVGLALRAQGRFTDAEPLYREVLEKRRALFGLNDPETLRAMNNMGAILGSLGRDAEAEAILRETLERRRATLTEGNPNTLRSMNILGHACEKTGKVKEAEALYREAIAGFTKNPDHNEAWLAEARWGLGSILAARTEFEYSERELLDAHRLFAAIEAPPTRMWRGCADSLVMLYEAWEKAKPNSGYAEKAAEWRKKGEDISRPR